MPADIADGSLLLALNLGFRLAEQPGALFTGFLLSFLHDGIACSRSLFQYLGLPLACLLQDGFTFLLYIGQFLVGLMSLAQAVVDVLLALVHHLDDGGKAKLGKHTEDHQKRNGHPEEETEIGRQNCR